MADPIDELRALAAAPPEAQATWHASLLAEEYAQIENAMARPIGDRRIKKGAPRQIAGRPSHCCELRASAFSFLAARSPAAVASASHIWAPFSVVP